MIYEHLSLADDNVVFDPDRFVAPKNTDTPDFKPEHGTGLWAAPVGEENDWKVFVEEETDWQIRSSFRFALSDAARVISVTEPADIARLPTRKVRSEEGFDWSELTEVADALFVSHRVLREEPFRGYYTVPSLLVLNPHIVVPCD